jgi:hypothetical protein
MPLDEDDYAMLKDELETMNRQLGVIAKALKSIAASLSDEAPTARRAS